MYMHKVTMRNIDSVIGCMSDGIYHIESER